MKRDWLLYLVIFSLALNLGTIGTFAYLRWQDRKALPLPPEEAPVPFARLLQGLDLDREQRQILKRLAPEHRHKVRNLLQELTQQRQELFSLLQQEQLPDWPPVQLKIKEIGNLQMCLEEEKVHHLLEVQKNLKPEQRRLLMTSLEKRLSHFWGKHGRHRGLMRSRPGPGFPGEPQGPPEPPENK